MAEEQIDIVDKNDKPTGKTTTIKEAHAKGHLHRSAHIWIYNSKGEILLQHRAKTKHLFPDMWDISAAGHVSAGEDPIVSGVRELEEELGIKINKKDLELLDIHREDRTYKDIINNEYYYVYIMKKDVDLEEIKMAQREVDNVRFIDIDTLKKEIKENPEEYVPSTWYWDFIIKTVKERMN